MSPMIRPGVCSKYEHRCEQASGGAGGVGDDPEHEPQDKAAGHGEQCAVAEECLLSEVVAAAG